jgi:hypothetical protein
LLARGPGGQWGLVPIGGPSVRNGTGQAMLAAADAASSVAVSCSSSGRDQ